MEEVIESKRYVPCISEEDLNQADKQHQFICRLPENMTRIIRCESEDGNELQYSIIDNDYIEVTNQGINPFIIFYEVSKSQIIENLIQEIDNRLESIL